MCESEVIALLYLGGRSLLQGGSSKRGWGGGAEGGDECIWVSCNYTNTNPNYSPSFYIGPA